MWPFKRSQPDPGASWVQETVQRVNVVHLDLDRRLTSLEHTLGLLAEGVAGAKAVDARMGRMEAAVRAVAKDLQDDVGRLTSSLEQVRGLATGARGGRPRNEEREADRQALELGRRVIQAAQTPEGRAQLALELQGGAGVADPVGAGRWIPGGNGQSPV